MFSQRLVVVSICVLMGPSFVAANDGPFQLQSGVAYPPTSRAEAGYDDFASYAGGHHQPVPPPTAYAPVMTGAPYEVDCPPHGKVRGMWWDTCRKLIKPRKAAFQRYNHNCTDLGDWPSNPPYFSDTWGYNETCWRRSPLMRPCPPHSEVYPPTIVHPAQ
jgi:hypothetical protein